MASPSLWQATALTLFPEMFPGCLGHSLAGKALEDGIWTLDTINLRRFAYNKHGNVDDKPFGGGTGMVIRPEVLGGAIDATQESHPETKLIYLSPRGKVLNQDKAFELIQIPHVTFICGRFEGIDQRVITHYNIEEISIGDYILSGGEPAALVVMDCCVRLLPGVISKQEALEEESFRSHNDFSGLLEYPHYTRPSVWNDVAVPEVLLSGNHAEIRKWRLQQSQEITKARRKDLWEVYLSAKGGI